MSRLYIQASGRKIEDWGTVCIVNGTDGQSELEGYQKRCPGFRWRLVAEDQVSNKVNAWWSISLDLTCPYCRESINLLQGDWPEDVAPIECGTDRTKDYDVECPGCDRTLMVNFRY